MLTPCQRPSCVGRIEDGFCTDCGLAPAGAPRIASAQAQAGSVRTGSVASAPSSPLSARTGSRSRSTGTRGTAGLGAGFVSLPPLPSLDPLARVLRDPTVAAAKRVCGACQKKLSLVSGFCPHCGAAYCFEPALVADDLVAGQYEVRGPIAFGGLGWIYLAQDQKLKQRWVVLKGLLNSKDAAAGQAALQEREFLSAVKHPNIVSVYNFATHGQDGYIVMEYVGGKTLAEIRKERGPLPVAEAIAYIHRVLPAFGYLHDAGMVYCDLKPSNVMVDADVKLIDMGGVRRVTDTEGDVYGTKGFFAPEIGEGQAPTFASDLFTVARTLATLVCDFDFQGRHAYTLPGPEEEPLFQRHESLARFLAKATRPRPDDRFQSAEEMAEQLLGVLRDVASGSGTTRVVESRWFGAEPGVDELPELALDGEDAAAAEVRKALDSDGERRMENLMAVARQHPDSAEARLRVAEAFFLAGSFADADALLAAARKRYPGDWRPAWMLGRSLLAQKKPGEARACFEHVLGELPGELAPKLACALACEKEGAHARAARLYDLVSRCDPRLALACFGLARCCEAAQDKAGALEALGRVPASSAGRARAQVGIVDALLDAKAGEAELHRAAVLIESLAVDAALRHDVRARFFERAVACVEAKPPRKGAARPVLGVAYDARALRAAAEQELRLSARHAESDAERFALVDRANRIRPFSLV